jgi:ABC-type amino acid transport substrate-binding protein
MKNFILTVVLSAFIAFVVVQISLLKQGSEKTETAYERVMRTKTLRCGYATWPPSAIYKDAKTGALTGIFPEIIEEMGKNMGLKVQWVEETGWGSFIEGLETKRYDAFCAPLGLNAERGMRVAFTVPIVYVAQHLYVRKNDFRFDKDLSKINDPSVTLATMDGEMSEIVARSSFPKAKTLSIPQLADITQLFMNVATGKADGVFFEPSLAKNFAASNPGKIRQATQKPYATTPAVFGVSIQETELQNALNSALTELHSQGAVDRIIAKHELDRSIFLRVADPFVNIKPAELP